MKDENNDRQRVIKNLAPFLNLGWQLVASICLMALLGWWLDGKLGTTPWLTIVGSLLGVAIGMFTFIKTVRKLTEKQR